MGPSLQAHWQDNTPVTFPTDLPLFERINAALPQTQCTRCGYPDCAAYAAAIAAGNAAINQCPPGGAEGVQRLSVITGQSVLPLNPTNGTEGPRAVAFIDENWCIGCTLCIKACPTDAIMGSNKMMHTVIEPWCTGCELCIPVCPVDCIGLENVTGTRTGWAAWSPEEAGTAKARYHLHQVRYRNPASPANLEARKEGKARVQPNAPLPTPAARPEGDPAVADRKRAVIEAALARARAQRESGKKS